MRTMIVAALVAGATVLAGPAHAATWTERDARHDVVTLPAAEDVSQAVPAPDRRQGDVTRIRVDHRQRTVVVTLPHDRLDRPTGRTQAVHVVVLRSGGRDRTVSLVTDRAHPRGQLLERPCRAARARIDYRADRVRFTVPTTCLGSPRAVRVGGGTGILAGDLQLHADDALLDGRLLDEPVLGPRVRVG